MKSIRTTIVTLSKTEFVQGPNGKLYHKELSRRVIEHEKPKPKKEKKQ